MTETTDSVAEPDMESASTELERLVKSRGIASFGVADISDSSIEVRFVPKESVCGLDRAISMGCRLSDRVMESLVDRPTPTYRYHYRQINQLLDSAASAAVAWIQDRGYGAFPIPSSQILDWQENKGHLWHVAVACKAGVAFWGRNNLAVSPLYGARVRYVTVVTDMPLPVTPRLELDCGECVECIGACPAGAIGHYPEEFDVAKCNTLLSRFSKELSLGVKICGLCVKACRGEKNRRPR
jgi:epoxyqueuosine reductase